MHNDVPMSRSFCRSTSGPWSVEIRPAILWPLRLGDTSVYIKLDTYDATDDKWLQALSVSATIM
eukprot:6172075-Pleurochrysis_carterae.AAC.1